jgi:uncharacterized ferritin-like protein (DUF455 family)
MACAGGQLTVSGNLFAAARQCLDCNDPLAKCALTDRVYTVLQSGDLALECRQAPAAIGVPGRPRRPRLVPPRQLPRRRPGSTQGRVSLLHALAHIEFNAINLAWDAVYRFRGMPEDFYADWARVAHEEAHHYRLLAARLEEMGSAYGRLDAHDGLWEMARKTAHDPLVRMALVPRVLEARGLDVTPGIIERLEKAGDQASVAILKVILQDEIGHVRIGTHWFRYLCRARGLEPEETFERLLHEYMRGQVKQPFHYPARERAGFNTLEMACLEKMASEDSGAIR